MVCFVLRWMFASVFRCSYEDTLGPGADCSRWITHVNHLGEELGVDYVWYRNPDPRLEPMEPAWESIVYQVCVWICLLAVVVVVIPARDPTQTRSSGAARPQGRKASTPRLPRPPRIFLSPRATLVHAGRLELNAPG